MVATSMLPIVVTIRRPFDVPYRVVLGETQGTDFGLASPHDESPEHAPEVGPLATDVSLSLFSLSRPLVWPDSISK